MAQNEDASVLAGKKLMKALGSVLKKTIKEQGPEAAIEFCSEKAMSITQNESESGQFQLKRISDKPRNVKNKASEKELQIMKQIKKDLQDQKTMKVYKIEGVTYMPLITKNLCLTCHGCDIPEKVKESLAKNYPEDKATGYLENQLRGLLVVTPK
jgi:hypothetical protein